jgi:hypothetical protein
MRFRFNADPDPAPHKIVKVMGISINHWPPSISVEDRHLVGADPDPTFHFDANPEPDHTKIYT